MKCRLVLGWFVWLRMGRRSMRMAGRRLMRLMVFRGVRGMSRCRFVAIGK
jgi:hypothetical protein